MSLSNEQLLLLDALVYYPKLSDKDFGEDEVQNISENKDESITIGKFINSVKKKRGEYQTVFNNTLGYTDEDLGMDKIISLVDNDPVLKNLVIVYPYKSDDKTTSSICLVDPATSEVYVIYVANYAQGNYKYKRDGEEETINSWVCNVTGAKETDTTEQKRQLDFYNESVKAARRYLGNEDGDLNITVSGHSAGGNHAQYVTIVYGGRGLSSNLCKFFILLYFLM